MENIRIIFVIPGKFSSQNECSEVMHSAYEICKQNVNTNVNWISESKFKPAKLNKTDFVVFEEFEGKVFEELKSTKSARIVGPWAVTICLMKGQPIPNFDWPIYNVAMYDCIVTCSHLPKNIKLQMKTKIELMGGCYVDSLLEKNTHLITGSAKSEKYLIAAEAGVKLMRTSWVEKVWEVSQNTNVHADDDQFKSHYCLAFHNLVISSTGITNPIEKMKIEKMIKANGGIFTGKLNLTNTDILICCGDVIHSEKYKAARQNTHIKCVDVEWVTDSVAKGYALPHHLYQVKKITSTPTKYDKPVNPEFSILSAIGGLNASQQTSVDDSIATFSPRQSDRVKNFKRKAKDYYEDLVDNLDIKKAKRAGQYLDGCSVYLTGFSTDHTEKLNKIINLSGATRYDTFSDRVTHVIVGDTSTHEMTLIKNKNTSAVLVSIHWLVDSIEEGHPVSEEKYLIISERDNSQLGSPLSKKGLSLLRANRTATEKDIELGNINKNYEEDEEMQRSSNATLARLTKKNIELNNMNNNDERDEEITTKNSTASNISDTLGKLLEGIDNTNFTKAPQIDELPKATPQFQPSETSTQQSSISVTQDAESEIDKVFENIKFLVIGFDEEEFEKLKESILELGGEVVSKTYKGIPDFALVPVFNQKELRHTASEVINDLFIADCIRERELILSIPYYHRPFDLPDAKPLENCVVTISSYTGTERVFLKNLIEALGGLPQEQFSRIRQEAKNLLPSTHLVSPEPAGKKYEAALKWGLPVVGNDWLLECAKTGKRVYEGDYLLGDSKAPDRRENSTENTLRKDKSLMEMQKTTSTPTSSPGPSRLSKVLTPVNQVTPYHKRFLNSAEKFSQVTPVNKIMKQFRESNLNSSVTTKETTDYTIPQPWAFVKTPNTPLEACLTPNPSSSLRKQCAYWLQQIPDKGSPKSNKSTPLSEIKRQLWEKVAKINGEKLDFSESGEGTKLQENEDGANKEVCLSEAEETPEKQQLANRLQQLEDLLSASGCGKRQSRNFQSTIPVPAGTAEFKDSQPCTVGWDFRSQEEHQSRHRIFSLSGIADDSERARMVQQIEQLGGTVSSLANYDPACTHLICPKAGRNEKTLSCMAAGKWILHTSYLEKSVEVGYLVDEEDYEFGNPKSVGKFPSPGDRETECRMQKMHWWRKEVSRRGYGAFNDMRAIIVANKRDPIVRVVEAGGGVVIDMKPPFDDTIHATHCLLEQKSVKKIEDYIPLAKQGIFLVNTVYISDYLHQPNKNIRECILPYFSKYYGRS